MTRTDSFDIRHDTDSRRYEASTVVDGEPRVVGVLRYEPLPGAVAIVSTVVVPEFRGRGVAAALTAGAVEGARAAGLLVRPDCWYAAQWLDRHPEVRDVVWSREHTQGTMAG